MKILCAMAGLSGAAYLLGSINCAVLISRLFFGDDVRNHGSGNAGDVYKRQMQGHPAVRKLAVTYRSDRYLSEDARILIGLLQKLLR